ncbi:MAG: GNAT family N-acetyltransferase [Chloroflexi bacterium]|nr:GNAT family N-acetyltransferase [Chloroflexota bacterium]
MIETLLEGKLVYLGSFDPEGDAEVESVWTHDPEYTHLFLMEPARPLSPGQIRKKHQAEGKADQERFFFSIRKREDNRMIGLVVLDWINWPSGYGRLALVIGDPRDRGHGYGSEALQLLLKYAFTELNLSRLTAFTFEYNLVGIHMLEKAGFLIEVRQRQAINRRNQRWDLLVLGALKEDWQNMVQGVQPG